jgi:hypothetical protein
VSARQRHLRFHSASSGRLHHPLAPFGCGISRDFLDQVLNVGIFPLDEAQDANVLLFVKELMKQAIAIISCRWRSIDLGRGPGR